MRRGGFMLALVLASAWASGSAAADKPVIAPPESWVKELDAPKPGPETAPNRFPIRFLLEDMQEHYGADGDQTYDRRVIQVVSPEGLAIGNLQFAWRPDSEALTVHHLRILRGDQVIDVLGSGQTFTVLRRENNLERAMLDGALTAIIQPEGLQVGDILDYSVTLTRHDPSLQGHSEFITTIREASKIEHVRLRHLWAAGKPMRWSKSIDMPEPKLVRTAAGSELTFDLRNATAVKPPVGAPGRFTATGQIALTEYADWSDISRMMAPLYDKAATLEPQSPLKAEAAKIAALSSDPKVRASAALKLVQDRIRYLYLGMSFGAYTPTAADVTWGRRFGDCKAKTVLLLALLHELGIEAEPAFVSTVLGDGLDTRLPMMELFDHAIVRARIDGKTYWLDGTRSGDGPIETIATPKFWWALPVRASGAPLEKMVVAAPAKPITEYSVSLDATAGLNALAPAHYELVMRGDDGKLMRDALKARAPKDIEDVLKATFEKSDENVVTFLKGAATYDEAAQEERWSADVLISTYWVKQTRDTPLRFNIAPEPLGADKDFKREPGPNSDAPFSVPYPAWQQATLIMKLPRQGDGFSLSGDPAVDQTVAGVRYRRTAKLEKGVITVQSDSQAVTTEIPFAEAKAASGALYGLRNNQIYVQGPVKWEDNDQETAMRIARKPALAVEYGDRAGAFFHKGDYAKAFADLGEAIKLKPEDSDYWNSRCFWRAEANRDLDAAMADCTEALRLAPNTASYIDSRGMVWFRMGKLDEALKDYDTALAIRPGAAATLFMRGVVKHRKGLKAEGDADIKTAEAADPEVGKEYGKFGIVE